MDSFNKMFMVINYDYWYIINNDDIRFGKKLLYYRGSVPKTDRKPERRLTNIGRVDR